MRPSLEGKKNIYFVIYFFFFLLVFVMYIFFWLNKIEKKEELNIGAEGKQNTKNVISKYPDVVSKNEGSMVQTC